MVTHPDINPVQQSLTSVNSREPVFSLLVIAVPQIYRSICWCSQNGFFYIQIVLRYQQDIKKTLNDQLLDGQTAH